MLLLSDPIQNRRAELEHIRQIIRLIRIVGLGVAGVARRCAGPPRVIPNASPRDKRRKQPICFCPQPFYDSRELLVKEIPLSYPQRRVIRRELQHFGNTYRRPGRTTI